MNGKPFENALKDTGNIGFVSRTMRLMQFVFLGLKGRIWNEDECEDKGESYDMCKAINDIKKKARNEGRKNGLKLGKEEGLKLGKEEGLKLGKEEGLRLGEENAIRKMIRVLLERSFRPVDICTITGATETMVREVAAQGNFVL